MKETINPRAQRGATLVVGMILLALVTLLGLAGAGASHIERRVAQNERFRENADSAASAGIEFAIGRIVSTPDPVSLNVTFDGAMPRSPERYSVALRFAGLERAVPQEAGSRLAGAHFEIVSTGRAARSIDRQRATVMFLIDSPDAIPLPCVAARTRCPRAGDLLRTSWQRIPVE